MWYENLFGYFACYRDVEFKTIHSISKWHRIANIWWTLNTEHWTHISNHEPYEAKSPTLQSKSYITHTIRQQQPFCYPFSILFCLLHHESGMSARACVLERRMAMIVKYGDWWTFCVQVFVQRHVLLLFWFSFSFASILFYSVVIIFSFGGIIIKILYLLLLYVVTKTFWMAFSIQKF